MKGTMKQFILDLMHFKKKRCVFILVILISMTIMFSTAICNIVFASSDNGNVQKKRFVSVKIEAGDTLWGIAENYYHKSGQDKMSDYIKEIKLCNGLSGDTIHAGRYLVIPYFSNVSEE